jgi:hypothetical protein
LMPIFPVAVANGLHARLREHNFEEFYDITN